jgi:hypothetical protein
MGCDAGHPGPRGEFLGGPPLSLEILQKLNDLLYFRFRCYTSPVWVNNQRINHQGKVLVHESAEFGSASKEHQPG